MAAEDRVPQPSRELARTAHSGYMPEPLADKDIDFNLEQPPVPSTSLSAATSVDFLPHALPGVTQPMFELQCNLDTANTSDNVANKTIEQPLGIPSMDRDMTDDMK